MEAPMEWKGRALLVTHAQPPGQMGAYAPLSPKHAKTHYPLVVALLILMAVAVAAICCRCYQWEGQMRLQARLRGHSHTTDSTPSSSTSQEFCGAPRRVSSVSVMMPGDDIPRFIAWTVPQGSAPAAASAIPEARKPTPVEPDQKVADN